MRRVTAVVLLAAVAVAEASTSTPRPDDPAFDLPFPEDFIFSSATASYQVEGAWNTSGKGENVWDRTTHEHPELVLDGSNGDVACDSYHKYKEDIRLAKALGTKMYRFSLSWSRLLPTGAIDVVNADGVRYYNAIIDECIRSDIIPFVTIFHWDLPQPLQDLGGFPNKVLADYFEDYADFVFNAFGDRVKWWITFNEPWSFCADGYGFGHKAPAIKSQGLADYLCAHTLLKAHARAFHLYKNVYSQRQQGKVGLAANTNFFYPKDPNNTADVAAAQRSMECNLGWFTHPIFSANGDYPPEMKRRVEAASARQGRKRSRLPKFTAEEVTYIKGTADFYAINAYTSSLIADADPADLTAEELASRNGDCGLRQSSKADWETTVADWFHVVPEGLRKLLNWIKDEYNNPTVIITENGYPDSGELKDEDRVRYFTLYMLELLKAIHYDNCKVIGYTAWSLMDNYEWFYGYVHKYGLYHVDFTDPERPRTPKMSANFFQRLIQTRKVPKPGDIIFPDGPTELLTTTSSSLDPSLSASTTAAATSPSASTLA